LNGAYQNGNETIINYLIEKGADIHKENNDGETPLFFVCENGNENGVRYLIEHGAQINKENNNGETP
ncbi:ankyrin, partial [Anaeromyces robustus]